MSTYLKVIAVGNLGQDPETKHFDGGGQVTNISIATTENWKDKNTGEKKSITEWSRVSFNGKLSEIVDKYVKKGDKILVEGKLRTRKWTDANGIERYTTEIIANNMTMLGSKDSSGASSQPSQPVSAVDAYQNNQSKPNQETSNAAPEEDDLPF